MDPMNLNPAVNTLDGSQDNPPPTYANGVKQRPMQKISAEDLPPVVNRAIEYADRDKSMYMGNPQYAGPPSFGRAVSGIENGDFQGLEMMDFGALADGTPAASFTDEDGQRQVIKLTVPQWMGAIEHRSQSRKQLEEERKLDAKRKAFVPYFNNMAKKVTAAQDPDIGGYLAAMYQVDPEMAMKQLGEFQREQNKANAEMVTWRGKPVTKAFAQQAITMEQNEYQQGNAAYRESMKAYQDQPYAAPLIENMVAMRRRPDQYSLPSTMTLVDSLQDQDSGPLPLVTLFQAMTKPMMTGLPVPAQLPAPDLKGQYNMAEVQKFLGQFNMVGQRLGWSPVLATDEVGLSAMVKALDIANNTRGAVSTIAPPPERIVPVSLQRQEMADQARMQQQEAKYGAAGAPKSPEQQKSADASANETLSSAVQLMQKDANESPRDTLMRIQAMGSDPAKLARMGRFSREEQQLIIQAARVIDEYSTK
jgi:hypothetical protein